MIDNENRFLACIDEKNDLTIVVGKYLYELGSQDSILNTLSRDNIYLEEVHKSLLVEMEDFIINLEEKFLESNFLYSKNSKRKIFYSNRTNMFFILEWRRGEENFTIHPFKDFDTLFLGAKEEDINSLTSSIALEIGALSYDPVLNKLLERWV